MASMVRMWSRLSMPMGARISSTVGFTPNFWKARAKALTGAKQP